MNPSLLGFGTSSARIWNSRSEEHTSELQSQSNLVCRLLLEKKTNMDHRPHPVGVQSALPPPLPSRLPRSNSALTADTRSHVAAHTLVTAPHACTLGRVVHYT